MIALSGKKIIRAIHAELDKLMTLPSIWITLALTLILNVFIIAAISSSALQEAAGTTQRILQLGLTSMGYIQAGFIILGILATCSEYTGGQIRTTLTTIPWRSVQLSAKYVALSIIIMPVAMIVVASGVLSAVVMTSDTAVVIETGTMTKTIIGAAGYLTLTTILSAAIGGLLRRTTPTAVILMGYYFIVSPLTRDVLPRVLPDTAGYYMYMPSSCNDINALTAIQGTGILIGWTLIFIAISIVLYRKRDA